MQDNIRSASYLRQGREKQAITPQKRVVMMLIICVTILLFTGITRGSLCELRFRQNKTEVTAVMAYESSR